MVAQVFRVPQCGESLHALTTFHHTQLGRNARVTDFAAIICNAFHSNALSIDKNKVLRVRRLCNNGRAGVPSLELLVYVSMER